MSRSLASYLYLAALAGAIAAANWLSRGYSSQADNVAVVAFLTVATPSLGLVGVVLRRGRLTLSAIALGASSLLLNPIDATISGLAIAVLMVRRPPWVIAANALTAAATSYGGAVLAGVLRTHATLSLEARLIVLLATTVCGWSLIAAGLSIRSGDPVRTIVHDNFTASFYAAFGYFALASLLISYVLDGSAVGFVLAAIVCVLALALTDTIAGRRLRQVLESELSDADRHLFHSRAVEGVVHNLRNHIASAVGYLKEIDLNRLDPVDREAVETATAAANDAVTVLRSLSQGATPRVSFAPTPIDLNELVGRALGMARPRAKSKEIVLTIRESPEEVNVKADPLLLREVMTNLINNAIDAAPKKGQVVLSTGRRGNGWPYFAVADNGPGVSDENRHHLFEPHFTTKETGTGLGLFMSYGIVKEHQGDILYQNNRPHGAVFTVVLPPSGA